MVAASSAPGASVAGVAQAFGVNDNLVHQWRRGRGFAIDPRSTAPTSPSTPEFISLAMPAESPVPEGAPIPSAPVIPTAAEKIQLEFRRGALAVSVAWPMSAAADCAAWLRELLR